MKYALKNKYSISNLLKTGLKLYSKSFSITYSKQKTDNTRFLIMVAKKYFKHATIRNKIRRQFKSMILTYKNLDYILKEFIVVVKSDYDVKNFFETCKSLTKLLNKL